MARKNKTPPTGAKTRKDRFGSGTPVPDASQSHSRSWDAVAGWYAGWAGPEGSRHHREMAIPALLALLEPRRDERILDIGCGAGALAPAVMGAKARYTGVDSSGKLIAVAKRHHSARARFIVCDATNLPDVSGLRRQKFDAATFLLSLQDINPLEQALNSAASVLKPGGRLVAVMTHPCFRIPRQSGWGWDEGRRLRYRRIDRYLSRLEVPMQDYGGRRPGSTRSYHRPLGDYVEALCQSGFVIDALKEIPAGAPARPGTETRAERLAREEIPLFFALRAIARIGE